MAVYKTGTVTLSGGSAEVIGTDTAWSFSLTAGGMFSAAGIAVPILSVDNDTKLTLAYPWPGVALVDYGYAIAMEYSEAVRAVWTNAHLATIVQRLNLIGIHPDYSGPLADRDALNPQPATGKFFLRCAPAEPFEFYRKENSGWSGPYGVEGRSGDDGAPGTPGPSTIGVRYLWDAGTTNADPGDGKLRFNNAAVASVTAIYLSETTQQAQNIAAYLQTFDDSTNTAHRGIIKLAKNSDQSVFALFNVTGAVTDSGTYNGVVVTHLASGGTFAPGDELILEFYRTGNIGAAGATGSSAGLRYNWSTTITDADPGNGIIKANHATFASQTFVYIDNQDQGAGDCTTYIDSWDDSDTPNAKGYLLVANATNPLIYRLYLITGTVIVGTGYRKVPVTPMATAGTIANAAALVVQFYRTGNRGLDGAGSGDMLKSTYDPTNKNGDAFARGNHTGSQLASTISDFSTAADARISGTIGSTIQAYNVKLDALSALSATGGVLIQTGADGFTKRTLAGTTDQITVVNGSGVSGPPTFSLAAPVTASLGKADTALQPAAVGSTVQGYDADLAALAAIVGQQGDIIFHNGTQWVRLAKGTVAGQALVMNSGLTAPEWATVGGTAGYTSPVQTIANNTTITLAHGLGAKPTLWQLSIVCQTAEHGYAVGEEVPIFWFINSASLDGQSSQVSVDATNLYIVKGSSGSAQQILSKATRQQASITNANWRYIARAWRA